MSRIEKLLIPRWKVLIDFPRCPFELNEVIDGSYYYMEGHQIYYDQFPMCFKKLRWWEEMDISKMPKFIKFERKIGKVLVYEVCSPHEGFPAFGQNYVNFFDEEGKNVMEEMRDLRNFLPATEEEFLQYKQNSHEKDS